MQPAEPSNGENFPASHFLHSLPFTSDVPAGQIEQEDEPSSDI